MTVDPAAIPVVDLARHAASLEPALSERAIASIPESRGQAMLGALVRSEMQRLLPRKLAQQAA